MTALAPTVSVLRRRSPLANTSALATLARRRFQLTVATPRELVVPLLTPVLFALVIAPALKEALHTSANYESYVATGTTGLLILVIAMLAVLSRLLVRH